MKGIPQHLKTPRLTHKQLKAITAPNAMVQSSLTTGVKQLGGKYIGATPEYVDINKGRYGVLPHWIKVRKGIPFVRADR